MSAPIDHRHLYHQIRLGNALAEAIELDRQDRHLRAFAATAHRIALPVLIGTATVFSTVCLVAQIAIRLHHAG